MNADIFISLRRFLPEVEVCRRKKEEERGSKQ